MASAIIAFSFGLRRQEPSIGNRRLAAVVADLHGEHPDALIIAQWEVAFGLQELGIPANLIIEANSDGTYLDSKQVWERSLPYLKERQRFEIIPVAQQVLHLHLVRSMIKQTAGFKVLPATYPAIGFDSSIENTQWWTRSKHALFFYAVGKTLKIPMHDA